MVDKSQTTERKNNYLTVTKVKKKYRNIYILNIFRGNLRETVHGTNLFRF